MIKKTAAIFLAVFCALSLFACKNKDDDKEAGNARTVEPDEIALSSENFSFTMAEASYVFFQNYQDFKYLNSDSFDMYNIDPDKSLKEQEYHDGITWFDYFRDETAKFLEELLVFCEAAKDSGMELDEDDMKAIDDEVQSWDDYAKKYDYTAEELYTLYLGENVNADVLRSYLEKETLAHKYYSEMMESYDFSDEELSSFVEDNRDEFYCINYIKYTFDEDTDSNALAHFEELAAITDPTAFAEYIDSHITNELEYDGDQTTLQSCYVNFALNDPNSEFCKWAFGGAAANSVYTEKNEVDGQYTVYLLTTTPSLQEYRTRNIRYIYEKTSSHASNQDTYDYVNGLLDKWKAGEATEDSFGEMAMNYSQDTTTNMNGGLETNIAKSSRDLPSGLVSWLFEDGRQPGDTTVVRGNQAYIAVYYIGEDEVQWKYIASNKLAEERYGEDYEEMSEKYPVTKDEEVLQGIKG